ncbi:glycoside hydrolase family 16 protein [Auriscalpium vulgare]|uniref:Glycoside hydrolase family 16 protein n=1 Tax=Auriscalpium vulgare TaxID=40419 RepID=A0ACB8RDC3_9AGAM|nr:glycoside hydrolase family 16 protein [Auriscalpium vulgare]
MLTASFMILFLAVAALASNDGSLRRHHQEHARSIQARTKIYKLETKYKGKDLLNEDKWDYFTAADPTGGQVKFLSKSDAVKDGLAYVQDDGVAVLKVDNMNDLAIGKNRNSVRITSTKTYNGGLFIADFEAMPYGCSVWPAWWSVGPDWPNGGEIDVVEGTNIKTDQRGNQYTLHSGAGSSCTLVSKSPKTFTGNVVGTTCKSSTSSNAGCGVVDPVQTGYGKDSNGVKMWHFTRNAIPSDITAGTPNPSSWPLPVVFLSSDDCDIGEHFYDHQVDTTLCGGWAGENYPRSGCPGTCQQAVANKTNFDTAKWKINYIAVYQ